MGQQQIDHAGQVLVQVRARGVVPTIDAVRVVRHREISAELAQPCPKFRARQRALRFEMDAFPDAFAKAATA